MPMLIKKIVKMNILLYKHITNSIRSNKSLPQANLMYSIKIIADGIFNYITETENSVQNVVYYCTRYGSCVYGDYSPHTANFPTFTSLSV